MKPGEIWMVTAPRIIHVHSVHDMNRSLYEKFTIGGGELFMILDLYTIGLLTNHSALILSNAGVGWVAAHTYHQSTWYEKVVGS